LVWNGMEESQTESNRVRQQSELVRERERERERNRPMRENIQSLSLLDIAMSVLYIAIVTIQTTLREGWRRPCITRPKTRKLIPISIKVPLARVAGQYLR